MYLVTFCLGSLSPFNRSILHQLTNVLYAIPLGTNLLLTYNYAFFKFYGRQLTNVPRVQPPKLQNQTKSNQVSDTCFFRFFPILLYAADISILEILSI